LWAVRMLCRSSDAFVGPPGESAELTDKPRAPKAVLEPLVPGEEPHHAFAAGGFDVSMLFALLGLGAAARPLAKAKARTSKAARASTSKSALATSEQVAVVSAGSEALDAESLAFDEWLPRVALLIMAMLCSTNFTLIKVLEESHPVEAVAAVRFGIAALLFLPMLSKHMTWSSVISGGEIGLWCALGYVTQAIGLQYTDASKGAFLCSLAMVVVPIIKVVRGGQVAPQIWAAVVFAITGTSFLCGVFSGDAAVAGAGPNMGDVLCATTAVGFGFMFSRMDDYAKEPDFNTLGCTIWQVVTLAVCMAVWLFATAGPVEAVAQMTSLVQAGPEVLLPLTWVGIVTTAGVLYIETWCMEKMDGAEAGVIFASEPVWATLFAAQVLGERFGATEAIGSALILTACLLTQLRLEGDTAKSEGDQLSADLSSSKV